MSCISARAIVIPTRASLSADDSPLEALFHEVAAYLFHVEPDRAERVRWTTRLRPVADDILLWRDAGTGPGTPGCTAVGGSAKVEVSTGDTPGGR